jgi:signal transduction histidine kinase
VRFDDRILTMLDYPATDAGSKAAVWVQLADLLAQSGNDADEDVKMMAIGRMGELRSFVSERRRLALAVSVAGRDLPEELTLALGSDSPAIAAPILMRAQLTPENWVRLIPQLPTPSRSLIRQRRDLDPKVEKALAAYGASDFALPPSDGAAEDVLDLNEAHVAPQLGATAIGDLVKRIEAYRTQGESARPAAKVGHRLHSFAFETDAAGLIQWVEGAPRGPLIGMSFAEMALPGGFGVDGQACGAFRKRAVIRDARLMVAGHSDAGGEWMISAQPFFDHGSGRFSGYRGIARRKGGLAKTREEGLLGLQPDSARQLVHELRTPLNAIRGFAEMMEGEFLGPIEPSYRDRAFAIVSDSNRLLRLFEDLDLSARMQGGQDEIPASGHADVKALLKDVLGHHEPLINERQLRVQVIAPDELPYAMMDRATLARLLDRIILCALGLSDAGETVRIEMEAASSGLGFAIVKPRSTRSLAGDRMLDASSDPLTTREDDVLPLGAPFLLRMIRQMAKRAGGRFEINDKRFSLNMPAETDSADMSKESVQD